MNEHAVGTDQDELEDIVRVLAGYIPDVGDTFTHTVTFRNAPGYSATDRYRVDGWLRRQQPRPLPATEQGRLTRQIIDELRAEGKWPEPEGHGPDKVPLEFCHRAQAEYVSGSGVAGVIVRVSDVKVDGRVPWKPELLADARRHANMLAGEPLR
jgi:hypothetical protein